MEKYYIVSVDSATPCGIQKMEIVMRSDCTVNDLPTNICPGSVAYRATSNGLESYMLSSDGNWEAI